MSTTCTAAWTTLRLLDISASRSRRSSGTLATPMFGSLVAKAYGAASAPPPVRALYSELFPALGRPTRPKRSMRPTTLPAPRRYGARCALGPVAVAVRGARRPRVDRRGGDHGGASRLGRHLRLGPPAGTARASRSPTRGSRSRRRLPTSGCTSGRWCWRCHGGGAARRPGGDDPRPVVGRPSRARARARRRQLRRVLRVRRAGLRRQGARRRARRGHRDCSCRCSRAVRCRSLGGRRTTAAGTQRPRPPIWIAGRDAYTAGPRRVARHGLEGFALVGEDDWSPETVTTALAAGGLARVRSTSRSSAAATPMRPRSRRPARRGASRRSSPARPRGRAQPGSELDAERRRRATVAQREGVVADAVAAQPGEAVECLVDARGVSGGHPPAHEDRLGHPLEPLHAAGGGTRCAPCGTRSRTARRATPRRTG